MGARAGGGRRVVSSQQVRDDTQTILGSIHPAVVGQVVDALDSTGDGAWHVE